jgi:hypothetical protein
LVGSRRWEMRPVKRAAVGRRWQQQQATMRRRGSWRPADAGVGLKEVVPLSGGAGEIQLRA